MKVPRFRIGRLLAIVAIAALNFAAIRPFFSESVPPITYPNAVLILGILPMANVLAVGVLVCHRRPECHSFVWGLEAFGAAAMAAFFVWASFHAEGSLMSYLNFLFLPLRQIGRSWPSIYSIPFCDYVLAAFVLGLPQLAFALIGGLLFHKGSKRGRS